MYAKFIQNPSICLQVIEQTDNLDIKWGGIILQAIENKKT